MFNLHKGIMLAITTMLIWGVCPILVKLGVKDLNPLRAFELRSIGVLTSFIIYSIASGRLTAYPSLINGNFKTSAILFIEGFLGAFLGQITYYAAQKYWEASKTVIVVSAFPIVSIVLAAIILHEPLTLRKCFGAALVLTGFYFVK
ncbi:MAG TPA: DMT family transporter [bacterium]|nr:DMT family transporter [bacterium]